MTVAWTEAESYETHKPVCFIFLMDIVALNVPVKTVCVTVIGKSERNVKQIFFANWFNCLCLLQPCRL